MNCPKCKHSTLQIQQSPDLPKTAACSTCSGRWLAFDDHLAWLESKPAPEAALTHMPAQAAPGPAPNAKARLCPRCGKLMARFRVSADSELQLERCGNCAGIWFDALEWETAQALTPLTRIQHVFNDSHQHKLSETLRQRQQVQRYRQLVGDAAYEKTEAFRLWMQSQARPDVIRAILDEAERL